MLEKADHCRYVTEMIDVKDAADCDYGGEGEEGYQNVETFPMAHHSLCTFSCYGGSDIFYSHSIKNSKNIFGSAGIKQGNFVIFNKKYEEQPYRTLVRRIIEHMKKTGEWGEFLPMKYSLFAYNETNAFLRYSLSKDDIVAKGWKYREPDAIQAATVVLASELPDTIDQVDDTILKQAIRCSQCQRLYKIIAAELTFYRNHHLPLPRLCYYCRYAARRAWRNPFHLQSRQCSCRQTDHGHQAVCPNTFQTAFPATDQKIIYCNDCYQATIY